MKDSKKIPPAEKKIKLIKIPEKLTEKIKLENIFWTLKRPIEKEKQVKWAEKLVWILNEFKEFYKIFPLIFFSNYFPCKFFDNKPFPKSNADSISDSLYDFEPQLLLKNI